MHNTAHEFLTKCINKSITNLCKTNVSINSVAMLLCKDLALQKKSTLKNCLKEGKMYNKRIMGKHFLLYAVKKKLDSNLGLHTALIKKVVNNKLF